MTDLISEKNSMSIEKALTDAKQKYNPEYKNKTVNSIVNGIYDALVFVSCLALFCFALLIADWQGMWSRAYFLYTIPMIIIIFHTIVVRVTRKDIYDRIKEIEK